MFCLVAPMRLVPTASQTAGPFFSFGLAHPEWSDLTGGGKAEGTRIRIEGRVLDGDKLPLADALVEIWQANAAGRYAHPEDRQPKPLDPHFRGFGRCATDKDGRYRFLTIKPGPVPGRGNALQAPHISFGVFARGLLKQVTTRLYFPDEALNKTDPVLGLVEDAPRRATLIATAAGQDGAAKLYRFDIVLQGESETVFFDV
jgi:protocatechuate 3,4-dioxygenase alpha subunit